MRVLLPPSETKRDGGDGHPVDLSSLLCADRLTDTRQRIVTAVGHLAKNAATCMATLRLGPKLAFEVERNRTLLTSPTLPAIDRYTGVLFDGLSSLTLDSRARGDLMAHVVIQSALWGPIAAGDQIPAYRLSHNSRLPKLPASLTSTWSRATAALPELWSGLVLDARSEGYVDLTPVPDEPRSEVYFLRVVTRDAGGNTRALNHFNKKAIGEVVRSLAESGALREVTTMDALLAWAPSHGWELERSAENELTLVISVAL